MALEIVRADVNLVTYDHLNDRLIFKAAIPNTFAGKVYEVGLWSAPSNNLAGAFGSRTLSIFDATEIWSAGVRTVGNARAGTAALRVSPAVSATVTASNTDVALDLAGYSGSDTFVMGYFVTNAFTSAVRLRFRTDANNYYTFTINTPTTGYKISTFAKSTATATGSPNWNSITQIDVEATSTAGGGAVVDFDAIRIEDIDTLNPDYVLVSREVLTTPYVRAAGSSPEVEYSLGVFI